MKRIRYDRSYWIWVGILVLGCSNPSGAPDSNSETPLPSPEQVNATPTLPALPSSREPTPSPLERSSIRGQVEIEAPDFGGLLEVATDRIPESFPADVPIPGDARLGSFMAIPGMGTTVVLFLSSSTKKVAELYAGALENNGWKIMKGLPEETRATYQLEAGKEERRLNVDIRMNENQGGTALTLTLFEGPTR